MHTSPGPTRRRVAVTGIGAVSPNGIGCDAFSDACLAGRSGLSRLADDERTAGEGLPLKSWAVGRVRDFDASAVMDAAEARRVPRMVHLALAASREAMTTSGLDVGDSVSRAREVAVLLGTGGGGLAMVEDQYRRVFVDRQNPSVYSITAGTHGNLSSELSIQLKLRGLSHVLSTGCASGTDALGHAMMLIRAGMTPVALAGGADAVIAPGILRAFETMRVVSTREWDSPAQACRPFDRDRDGFILGEGAWMFVLEDLDHAKARGAAVLAELVGYASTCDAYHRVQIAPDTEEPVRAMREALADAGLSPADVQYVNLHGTGTKLNDAMETTAIRRCFESHADRLVTSSTKSMIGHPQGACGAAGLAATILCARRGFAHPTVNLTHPDAGCDLDYTPNAARHVQVEHALCNCIAFGSKNSALVVRIGPA